MGFNYHHLYYFWVVAKEGGITRAAERLDIAVQTVSTQVHELEQTLGHALLKPIGRGLVLTEAGIAAMHLADHIFQLGEQLPGVVREAASRPGVQLGMGVIDGLPKLVVHLLMQPILDNANLRLRCREGSFENLLAALVLHQLDGVLADRLPATNPHLRVYSHSLGSSTLAWYAPASRYAAARRGFPKSLASVPVLSPTAQSAVRARIDQWFERIGIQPCVTGEFEDSALLKTFGASGMGVFPAAVLIDQELINRYGVRQIGLCEGVEEQFFLIGAQKKITHPLMQRLLSQRILAFRVHCLRTMPPRQVKHDQGALTGPLSPCHRSALVPLQRHPTFSDFSEDLFPYCVLHANKPITQSMRNRLNGQSISDSSIH